MRYFKKIEDSGPHFVRWKKIGRANSNGFTFSKSGDLLFFTEPNDDEDRVGWMLRLGAKTKRIPWDHSSEIGIVDEVVGDVLVPEDGRLVRIRRWDAPAEIVPGPWDGHVTRLAVASNGQRANLVTRDPSGEFTLYTLDLHADGRITGSVHERTVVTRDPEAPLVSPGGNVARLRGDRFEVVRGNERIEFRLLEEERKWIAEGGLVWMNDRYLGDAQTLFIDSQTGQMNHATTSSAYKTVISPCMRWVARLVSPDAHAMLGAIEIL